LLNALLVKFIYCIINNPLRQHFGLLGVLSSSILPCHYYLSVVGDDPLRPLVVKLIDQYTALGFRMRCDRFGDALDLRAAERVVAVGRGLR
jgi:hypothetical protein